MNIEIYTNSGESLIKQIFSAVEKKVLTTWAVRNIDGTKYLTHGPSQWYDKVLLEFKALKDKVVIDLRWLKDNGEPSDEIKGYYIGRFIEVLLVHFSTQFSEIKITTK